MSIIQNSNENLETSKQFLSGKEVQFLFQVSPNTLQRYRERGKLNPIKLSSKKFLYRKSEIEKLLS